MKWILSFVLCLATGLAFAQDEALKPGDVFIPTEYRIKNSYGNCVYCAAEDVFWGAAGHEEFQGIKERAVREGWRGAGMGNVLAAAKDAGIECVSTREYDYQVLYDAVANGCGAYIEIPGHAIVVVGIDEDGVRILDNNGDLKVQQWSAAEFRRTWEGHACFPLLNRRRKPKPPPEPTTPPVVVPVTPQQPEVKPGPAGPSGPQGPAGPPGKDADSTALLAKIAELQKQIEALKQPQSRTRIVPAKKGSDLWQTQLPLLP